MGLAAGAELVVGVALIVEEEPAEGFGEVVLGLGSEELKDRVVLAGSEFELILG